MVANIRGYTPNYGLKLINFDTPRWHTLEYSNWELVDAIIASAGIPNIRGEWINATPYIAGDRVFDGEDGHIYACLVTHTSNATGTFAEDRAAHPGPVPPARWMQATLAVPNFRGVWVPSVNYANGDIVYVNAYQYYLCVKTHTAGTTFVPSPNWQLVFDATAAVNDAAASATAAATSAGQAAGSASAAAISATSAQTHATNAANSATQAATSATDANNSKNQAATSAAAALASQTAAANSAAAAAQSAIDAQVAGDSLHGTSTTTLSIGATPKTLTTQAGKQFIVGTYVTITEPSDPTNRWMTGQITGYGGTQLDVNVIAVSGSGTFSDWSIDVTGAPGVAGVIGASTVEAGHLNADNSTEQTVFRDRLNFASRAGDKFVGAVTIEMNTPSLVLNRTSVDPAIITGRRNNVDRWQIRPGNITAESGGNTGSDFAINRYDDSGALLGGNPALLISRADGRVYLTSPVPAPAAANEVVTKGFVEGITGPLDNAKVNRIGDTMTGPLWLSPPAPQHAGLLINRPNDTVVSYITGMHANSQRWQIRVADTGPSADFSIKRFNDSSVETGTPLVINRATGASDFAGPVTAGLAASTLTTPSVDQFISGYGCMSRSALSVNAYLSTTGPVWKYLAAGAIGRMYHSANDLIIDLSAPGTANANLTTIVNNIKLAQNGQVTFSYGGFIANGGCTINANNSSYGLYVANAGPGYCILAKPSADNLAGLFINNAASTVNSHAMYGNGNYACYGNITVGSGGVAPGAQSSQVLINGGNATAFAGYLLSFQKAGSAQFQLGSRSCFYGDSSNDLLMWNDSVGPVFSINKSANWFNIHTAHTFIDQFIQTRGYFGKAGQDGVASGQNWNYCWTGSALQGWVQTTLQGNVTFASDYRIKKDVVELDSMWDVVKGLRPISYKQAAFDPPSEKVRKLKEKKEKEDKGEPPPDDTGTMFVEDDMERWGFIAHELQETLLESAATGVKDSPNIIQSPNWAPIVAALTKALQEAMQRIEELEARLPA